MDTIEWGSRNILEPVDRANPLVRQAARSVLALAGVHAWEITDRMYAQLRTASLRAAYLEDGGKVVQDHPCAAVVAGGACAALDGGACRDCRPPAADHAEMFIEAAGPRVYIAQPYELRWEAIKESIEFCNRNGLRMDVGGLRPSFHFPGRSLLIEYRRNAPPEPRDRPAQLSGEDDGGPAEIARLRRENAELRRRLAEGGLEAEP